MVFCRLSVYKDVNNSIQVKSMTIQVNIMCCVVHDKQKNQTTYPILDYGAL